MAPVTLDEIRDSAMRIAIRLALGKFLTRGPQTNVMEVESWVAWSTVTTELQNEGYFMVSTEEYATAYGLAPADIADKIERDGSLFALVYTTFDETLTVVPLATREEREHLGAMPK